MISSVEAEQLNRTDRNQNDDSPAFDAIVYRRSSAIKMLRRIVRVMYLLICNEDNGNGAGQFSC